MIADPSYSPALPNMFSHCRKCGAVLKINEEWHSGRCVECQQWEALYPLIDAIIAMPLPPKRKSVVRVMNRDS